MTEAEVNLMAVLIDWKDYGGRTSDVIIAIRALIHEMILEAR